MYAFMTSGTADFLKKRTEQYPNIDFHFMKSGGRTLVYYEDRKKKGIFVSGRRHTILYQNGNWNKKGFVAMEHIPVMEDGAAVFEERFLQIAPKFITIKGLQSTRLLKQHKSHHYIIITQWESERNFVDWQRLDHDDAFNFRKMTRLSAYFAERPFTNTYYMMKEEE